MKASEEGSSGDVAVLSPGSGGEGVDGRDGGPVRDFGALERERDLARELSFSGDVACN